MLCVDKPLSDIQRRRFDAEHKFNGLLGHTARKSCRCSACVVPDLSVERSDAPKNSQIGYLDAGATYGARSTSSLAEPYKLTAFEMEGFDAAYSMSSKRAWESVPAVLAENAVGLPAMRRFADGRVECTYSLQPTALILPEPAVAAAESKLATHIHELHRHRPRLWAKVPAEPPEHVTKAPLAASLHCVGNRVPQTAAVRVNSAQAYWNVASANGKPLDIDLGRTCVITAVSTQGRHPETRRYPHIARPAYEREVVEDACYLPNYTEGTKYVGPWWTVRTSPQEASREHPYHPPQWVSAYELLCRANGGREWHSLGRFVGNTDETSEVAHTFTDVRGGLQARYLRIVPLECEGGGALRVGVYGERAGCAAGGERDERSRRGAVGGPASEKERDSSLVQYTLTSRPTTRHYVTVRPGSKGSSSNKWQGMSYHSSNRHRRRLDAARDALEELGAHAQEGWQEAVGGEASDEEEMVAEGERGVAANMAEAAMVAGAALQEERETAAAVVAAAEAEVEREQLELALALSISMCASAHEDDTEEWEVVEAE